MVVVEATELEDRVRELFARGKLSILVVGDSCTAYGENRDLSYEHIFNEEDLERHAKKNGVDISFSCQPHDQIRKDSDEWLAQEKHDLILVKAHSGNPATIGVELSRSASNYDRLRKNIPNADIYYIVDEFPSKEISACVDQILPIFAPGITPHKLSFSTFHSIMEYLNYVLTGSMKSKWGIWSRSDIQQGLQHEYKNNMWGKYISYIDTSLRAGNSQSKIKYQFLILSDREKALVGKNQVYAEEKVIVKELDYALKPEDIKNCAAIFIDNAWDKSCSTAIGKGLATLQRIKSKMNKENVRIPIIYQSGHPMSAFAPDEQKQISDLGAVLATKDLFPKVCKGTETYEKEVEVGKLVERNPSLACYTTRVHDMGLIGDNFYVVCSKIATGTNDDLEKKAYFEELGIEDTPTSHKMYVLSLFHSSLKDQIGNKKLQKTSKDYFSFEEIQKASKDADLEPVRDIYNSIVEKHRKFKPAVITHNDAKWDNWFNGTVLGDFGSVQPGTEYKDIAKALLEENFVYSQKKVDNAINEYIALRSAIDGKFKPAEDFAQNAKEALLTEAMRTLFYKADQKIAEVLLKAIPQIARTL